VLTAGSRRCQEDPVSLLSGRLEKTTRSSPHHMAQHHPTGSETTPPYATRSSRFSSEPPSVEDDVDVWRYAIVRVACQKRRRTCPASPAPSQMLPPGHLLPWLRPGGKWRITCISPLLKSPPTKSPLQFHRIALHRLLNSPPLHYTADKLHRLVNLRHDEFSASQHTAAQSSVRE